MKKIVLMGGGGGNTPILHTKGVGRAHHFDFTGSFVTAPVIDTTKETCCSEYRAVAVSV